MIKMLVQQSFLEDMNHSFMMGEIMGEGFGAVIDYMIEKSKEPKGLFESKAEREKREEFVKKMDYSDEDDMFEIGDMIDHVIGGYNK